MIGFSIVPGKLVVPSTVGPVDIRSLSPVEVGLVAPERRLNTGDRLEVSLLAGMEPFAARVTGPDTASHILSAQWIDLELERARDIARLLDRLLAHGVARNCEPEVVEREVERDPARVREILRALFANRCPARLRPSDPKGRWLRLTACRIEPESETPLQWEAAEAWPPPPFNITVDGYMSQIFFTVEHARTQDGFLANPVPRELTRERSRAQRRVAAPPDVILSFKHPRWPELTCRRPVRNVSLDGLEIACSSTKDLIYPGLEIADATVTWHDRIVCRVSCVARHVSDDIDGEAQLAGFRIAFADPDEHLHWRQQVDALLYPNTRTDGLWSHQLWELYRESGYLQLSHKSEPEFAALKEAFTRCNPRLAGSAVGCQVVWPSSRGIEAAVSMIHSYEGGSFFCQLARRPGRVPIRFPGRNVIRDLYLHAIEDLQRGRQTSWLITWLQKDGRFSRLVNYEMPRRYVENGRSLIWPFRAMEADVARAPAPALLQWTVSLATADERERFLEFVQRTRAQAYVEAHDLSKPLFDQAQLRRQWASAGFERDRQLLVARRSGYVQAVALLESATDGLHLYRLLDVTRLYAYEDVGRAAFPALIDEARRWYREKGKAKFICFLESDDVEPARPAGLRDLGEADCVLLPTQLLPELLEHLYEVTASKDVPQLRP